MAARDLPALAAGDSRVGRRVRGHVDECLRCQAEIGRYRRLLRNLEAMRNAPVDPDPALWAEILAGIEATCGGPPSRRRAAYVGGISAATAAAGAAGVLVWVSRHRAQPAT